MQDLTVSKRRIITTYLHLDGVTLRGYHQRQDIRWKHSCPHCGQGQVEREVGATCAFCGAVVVQVDIEET